MKDEKEIINRVANSPLITFDLEEYYHQGERVVFDIKDWLFEGIILKERDFRQAIKNYDWTKFKDKNVAITCSEDAVIPTWAYMLITINLNPYANCVVLGDLDTLELAIFKDALLKIDIEKFQDKKIVIKGCGKYPVPNSAYVEIARILTPIASSIMYGEPCSTVPLFKKQEK